MISRTKGQYTNIASATTTVVKTGAGVFNSITINKWVTGAVVTIYDNTAASGTKIATITMGTADPGPISLPFNVAFSTGLTVLTGSATDHTVSWE